MTTMRQRDAVANGPQDMLDGLQALRGIAAVMVVIDHAMLAVIPYDPHFAPLGDFAGTIGKMGVNLFFVISGFIMMYTTEPTRTYAPSHRFSDFAWKRLTRLVPLYWLATLLTIAVGAIEGFHYTSGHILTSFTFLPNFEDAVDPRMTPIVGVGWTITYEMLFYSLFALCLLFPRQIGPAACMAIIVGMVVCGAVAAGHVQDPELRRIVAFYSYKNMLFFTVGIAIAIGFRRMPQVAGPIAIGGSLTLMVAALTSYWEFRLQNGGLVWQVVSFLTCTCVGLLAAGNARRSDIPARRLLLHIGNASFSTYLFHAPILHFLASLSAPWLVRGYGSAFIIVAALPCLVAGSLIHTGIELPITRAVRSIRRRHRSARVPVGRDFPQPQATAAIEAPR
ncbi:acyltransferase [Novosphingobium sp. BL-8H]|uniref:acyltransferase family protein n=1 Tax=Novosphingobium sp. BL-8H TaxID=3127640 RepID=UPI00375632E4